MQITNLRYKLIYILLTLILINLYIGCDEGGLNPADLSVILSQPIEVQTEIPDEVWAAMKIQADEMHQWVDKRLDNIVDDWEVEEKELLLEKGYDTIDFHALQKSFYTKYINAGGIAIVAPDKVEDVYLLAAREVILIMTSKRPELRERLLSKHGQFYMVLISPPVASDYRHIWEMPELKLNWYALTDQDAPFVGGCSKSGRDLRWAAEPVSGYCWATVLPKLYTPLDVFIHEFAHALEPEIEILEPGFFERVETAYDHMIMDFGEDVASEYAMASAPHEYWAYGVNWWFRRATWQERLIKDHPMLAEIIAEYIPRVECFVDAENPYSNRLRIHKRIWCEVIE